MCCEHCSGGVQLVDVAIHEGRIDASSRETFVKAFERAPEFVVETLSAAKPDMTTATRNYMASISEEEHLAIRADIAQRFNIPLADVA